MPAPVPDAGEAPLCQRACDVGNRVMCGRQVPDCVPTCERWKEHRCFQPYAAYAECLARLPASAYRCDETGLPMPQPGRCADTQAAFVACLTAPPSPDAASAQ